MSKIYITIVGMNYRYGTDILEKGMVVKLIKEPDNEYDKEAIRVDMAGLGTVGYVANSTKTVQGECMSAGRIYDRIGKKALAKVMFVTPRGAICKLYKEKNKKS